MNMTEKLAEAAMHSSTGRRLLAVRVDLQVAVTAPLRWFWPTTVWVSFARAAVSSDFLDCKEKTQRSTVWHSFHLVFSHTRVGHTVYNISTVDASLLATQHDKLDHCQSNKVTISAMFDG